MSVQVDIHIETVWGQLTEKLTEELTSFWIDHRQLKEDRARDRAAQAVLIARDKDKIVGVSTVRKVLSRKIGRHFYLFRCFIAPDYRMVGLDVRLTVGTREYLESEMPNDPEPKALGILAVIENPDLMEKWKWAIWPGSNLTYIGDTPEGKHVRIAYFKGAQI